MHQPINKELNVMYFFFKWIELFGSTAIKQASKIGVESYILIYIYDILMKGQNQTRIADVSTATYSGRS